VQLALRRRKGYRSFCAAVDLLGVRSCSENDLRSGGTLNDLQKGFAKHVLLSRARGTIGPVSSADSWFVVREVSPTRTPKRYGRQFCGHIFRADLASSLNLKPGWQPGIARGGAQVCSQIEEPDTWSFEHIADETRHWFVLTGADQALVKERALSARGKGRRIRWQPLLVRDAGRKRRFFWARRLGDSRPRNIETGALRTVFRMDATKQHGTRPSATPRRARDRHICRGCRSRATSAREVPAERGLFNLRSGGLFPLPEAASAESDDALGRSIGGVLS